jgi:preprotein translocase subunit SecD
MDSLRLRTWVAVLATLLSALFIAPNFVDTSGLSWWPAKKLNYGLDIQGGVHLVMGADIESVIRTTVVRQTRSLQAEFEKAGITVKGFNTDQANLGEFSVQTNTMEDSKKIEADLQKNHATSIQILSVSATAVDLKYFDSYLLDQKQTIVRQAIETIRNRIDEFGVAEPSITQQSTDRILVQLPGMADAERAKQLINTTAKLDFMLVSNKMGTDELQKLVTEAEKAGGFSLATTKYSEYVSKVNDALKGKTPENTIVYFEKLENVKTIAGGATPVLLETTTDLTGESLDTAAVSLDQYGNPEVSMRFNAIGSTKFADLTGQNVGRRMAVVLDKVIKTAPNINGKIPGGNAVITLGRSGDAQKMMDEAKLIATSLRAGALPVALEQLEERRVGPSLGKDALDKARFAAILGAILIIVFMLVWYKSMGVITSIVLLLNIIAIFAILGSLGATLTLPGIAGMALTVGFAVDANVLINERIREEFHKGATIKSAIQEGYSRAMSAIVDSNITTAATAAVLLYFGTGPVRGFAVTLLAGIATTLFANVFVSKVIVDSLVYKFNVQKISV